MRQKILMKEQITSSVLLELVLFAIFDFVFGIGE
jgi:hypothetical protein